MSVMSRKNKVSQVMLFTILVIGAFVCFFPFFWMVRTSLMDLREIYQQPPLIWSEMPKWENFKAIFSENFPFFNYARNTATIMLPVWLGTVLTSALGAYAFARFSFPLKKMWFTCILATMMLPGAVTLIPGFMIWNTLGLIDSYWPLIIPSFFGGGAFNIFLVRQFIMGLPRELDEAAFVEGAGYFYVFWRIIFPLLRPVIIVVSLFTLLGVWNDFMGPLIILYTPEKYTIALALQQFTGAYGSNFGVIMAGAVVTTIPALALFIIGQRYFINGMIMSGIKG